MSFEDLPDTVVQLIVAKLGLLDAISLSCTNTRLHRQATGASPATGKRHHSQLGQISQLAAAARQRLHVATSGAWRDELLLTAWQQQQIMAAAESAAAAKRKDPTNSRNNPVDIKDGGDTDMLQCGLGAGFTESARSKGRMQQQALVDFSGFFMPVPAMLDSTNCFITDGSASALANTSYNSSSSSPIGSSSGAAAACRQEITPAAMQPTARPSKQQAEAQPHQHHSAAWHLPTCSKARLYQQLQLVKGHIPPWPRPGRGLDHPPDLQCNAMLRNGRPPEPSNPVADVLFSCIRTLPGLQQLGHYLQLWKQRETEQRQQNILDRLKAASGSAPEPGREQGVHKQNRPLHLFLLANPAPAGSIAALNNPWPPVLQPGALAYSSDHGLSGDPLLRLPLIHQEAALVVRGLQTTFCGILQLQDTVREGLSPAFSASLQHLDLSGAPSSEIDIANMITACQHLKSLSVAGTSAAGFVFLSLSNPVRDVGPAKVHRQGPLVASSTVQGTSRRVVKPAGDQPDVLKPPGGPPSSSLPAAGQLRQLIVLDVSGCSGLQSDGSTGPYTWSIKKALGRLRHLRVLLACRIHVDGALLPPDTSAANATVASSTGTKHSAADSRAQQEEALEVAKHLLATLGGLIELDISGATFLSANCMIHLLKSCGQLKKLGVAGCTTLAAEGGTAKLQEALLPWGKRSQQTQEASQTPVMPGAASSGLQQAAVETAAHPAEQLQQQMETLSLHSQELQQPQEAAVDGHKQEPLQQAQQTEEQTAKADSSSTASGITLLPRSPGSGSARAVCLPSLTHLSVGWGWSAASIAVLLQQSDCLTSFSAGVGSCVTDSVLEALASSCQHLQHFKLSLCPVSSIGVGAVLASCRKLNSLQLQQCVGPFSMTNMLQSRQQQHHWQLACLQLDGPTVDGNDRQLLQLLGIKWQQQSVHIGPSQNPAWSALASLCLVHVRGLSDCLLYQLGAAGCRLQHFRLEECYSVDVHSTAMPDLEYSVADSCQDCQQHASDPGVTGADTSSNKWSTAAVSASFSQAALLHMLRQSCCLSLRSLQLRHAVAPLTVNFVELAVAAAPLLQRLVLDACDLPEKGLFEYEPGTHSALQAIHVVRCHELSEPLSAEEVHGKTGVQHSSHKHSHNDEHQKQQLHVAGSRARQAEAVGPLHNSSQVQQSETSWVRRRDKQLIVHLLHVGRSLHLPS